MDNVATSEHVAETPQKCLNVVYFQQNICWENCSANYMQIERSFADFFASSPSYAPDILVVPETFNTGFGDNMAQLAESPQGATYDFAVRMAHQYNALFVGTWTVREGNAVYNRLHWVRPDGTFGYYDKGHTFRMSSEASQLARGTQREIFEWRGWRIKPAVCYDLRFPKWLRNELRIDESTAAQQYPLSITTKQDEALGVEQMPFLPSLNYDLLLICANWPGSRYEAWSTLLKARAIENLAYVVGVNRVGTDGVGINYTGNSAAIDFKGHLLSECASGMQQVQCATLSADNLNKFRRHWPFYLDAD